MDLYGRHGQLCPSCGHIPLKRGVLLKCCSSPGCTWFRCRRCGAYGHPTGRWLDKNIASAADPHPPLAEDIRSTEDTPE